MNTTSALFMPQKEKPCLTSDKYFFFHKFTFYEIERLVSMTLLCEEDRC